MSERYHAEATERMRIHIFPDGPPCPACGNDTYDTVWGKIKRCLRCGARFIKKNSCQQCTYRREIDREGSGR